MIDAYPTLSRSAPSEGGLGARGQTAGTFSMVPILREAMKRGEVTGEHYRGTWNDIGTSHHLADINGSLSAPG